MSSQALVPVKKRSQDTENGQSGSTHSTETPSKSESAEAVKAETDKLLDDIDKLLSQDAIQTLQERLDEFDPENNAPLTLADLMREGSSVTDQAIGAWTRPTGETCALSAAMLAARARGLA